MMSIDGQIKKQPKSTNQQTTTNLSSLVQNLRYQKSRRQASQSNVHFFRKEEQVGNSNMTLSIEILYLDSCL